MKAYKREGEIARKKWMQYHLVEEGVVTHVDLEPAVVAGWNVTRVSADRAGFADMTTDAIAAYIETYWPDAIIADPEHVMAVISRYERRKAEASSWPPSRSTWRTDP